MRYHVITLQCYQVSRTHIIVHLAEANVKYEYRIPSGNRYLQYIVADLAGKVRVQIKHMLTA